MDPESRAFIAWLTTYELTRDVKTLRDLSDGAPLFDVLSAIDAAKFQPPTRSAAQLSENRVIRLQSLKRLFRLITQYFADVLRQPTSSLGVPDLQAIADNADATDTLAICRLVLAIAVQSNRREDVIDRIRKLNENDQGALMRAIEEVMRIFPKPAKGSTESIMTDDDHYYQLQSERNRALIDKETLENVYQALITEHSALQSSLDEALSEKADVVSRIKELERRQDDRRNEKADAMLRSELDRVRLELQKSEDDLASTETELEKQTSRTGDLTRKVEELQVLASQAVKLKDQVDEYKHTAEKAAKNENVLEKYKKKLEESADMRRTLKALEEQNASLVDKNASLEEEFKKVSTYRPLMESYKSQIVDQEVKLAAVKTENAKLSFSLEQAQVKLTIALREREQDSDALQLYQERVRELELSDPRTRKSSTTSNSSVSTATAVPSSPMLDGDDSANLGGELDDAITGRTPTDLKLEIRALKREIADLKSDNGSADESRVLVLENLLESEQRMKARYEADYLRTHRDWLSTQSQLEEIRNGKSLGDGAGAAIALRQRLNEVVEQFDTVRRDFNQLQVSHESQSRELTIAKSDLNLVNKDQLEILASLRESVNEDKSGLEAELTKMRSKIDELKEKNKMQLDQVNSLLMDKVSLQSDGLNQHERMLERERNFTDLRASINAKDLPEDTKSRLLSLHEENVALKEQYRTGQEKLAKAKVFIKEQDRIIKERKVVPDGSGFEEAESNFRAQIKSLEDNIVQLKQTIKDMNIRYGREQKLMLSHIHGTSMQAIRDMHSNSRRQANGGSIPASSWLVQRREKQLSSLR